MTLLGIHVVAGLVAIGAAAVALYAAKGARLHRESGRVFVYAMLVMSASAAVMAALQPNWANVLQGALTVYLVTTGLLTIRPHVAARHAIEIGATLVVLAIGVAHCSLGAATLRSVTGTIYGYPPPLYFIFGGVALAAAAGDVRMMKAGGFHGRRRIVRHLWRMCFATFIATGSFFLGQARVFPEPVRIVPLLAIPALAPLVLMLYWVARVSVARRYSRARCPAHAGSKSAGEPAPSDPSSGMRHFMADGAVELPRRSHKKCGVFSALSPTGHDGGGAARPNAAPR